MSPTPNRTIRMPWLQMAVAIAFLIATNVLGQHDQWIVGTQRVIFGDAGITTTPLPSFNGTDPLEYHGEKARFAQQLLWDHEGELAGFMVDGKIYDEEGYLISDSWVCTDWYNSYFANSALYPCENCVPEGITEMLVVPIPGQCLQYLLFTARIGNGQGVGPRTFVSLLDLAVPNPNFDPQFFPGRTGALVDLSTSAYEVATACIDFHGSNLEIGELPTPYITSDANLSVHMDALDLGWDQDKWVFVSDGASVQSFHITSTEVFDNGEETVFSSDWEVRRMPQGELECIVENGEMLVAFTRYIVDGTAQHHVLLLHYSMTGILTGTDDVTVSDFLYDPLDECNRINGLEFSQNGEYLYFLRTIDPELGYIDLSTLTVTIPTDPALDMFDHRNSELERDDYFNIGGQPPYNGMYAIAADGRLGRLRNTNTPIGLLWEPDFLEFDPSDVVSSYWVDFAGTSYPPDFTGDCPDHYYLLEAQTHNFTPFGPEPLTECCDAIILNQGFAVTVGTGNTTWEPGANPFGNATGFVYVIGDLVVPSGANLTIADMELRFGPGASVIVEPGGYLFSNGSTFTSACNNRWKRVEVRGNSNLGQLPYSNQGRFRTLNAVVENAQEGAVAATIDGNGGYVATGYKGVIQSANTQWRNNVVDVKIPFTGTINNMCRFQACDFAVDADWPSGPDPYAHAVLSDCGKVLFQNCKFRNTNATFTGADRGFGVLSNGSAAPRIVGNNNPAVSYFEGLWCAASIGRHRTYWVQKMNIRGCTYGVVDLGPNLGEITDNTFDVPEWTAGPSPIGVLLYQTKAYVVEDNLFQSTAPNSNAGVAFWGPMESTNRIYNNTFERLSLGSFVINDHQDDLISEMIGLEILCGDYTDNNVDYGVGPGCALASEQGDANNNLDLAGNRFFDTPNCTNDFDMAFDGPQNGSFYNYNRSTDPICDPCDNALYYSDNAIPAPPFDKEVDCANPFAPDGGIIIGHETDARKLAKAQFESALALYNSELDCGGHEELLEAINQDEPWLPSHTLRDMLIGCHPLRNAVLQAVIDRGQPMDAWHITQVFLQNVPLDKKLEKELSNSGLLNSYQLALIEQAHSGNPDSYKRLLEREIHQRATEHYMAYTNCARYWAADTIDPGAEDSLRLVLDDGISTGDRMALLLYHLQSSNWTALQAMLQESWFLDEKHTDLRDYVAAMRNVYGNVDQLSTTDLQDFEALASAGNAGAGLCWSVLLQRDHWRYLPEVPILSGWKRYEEPDHARAVLESLAQLQVQPSPATDVIHVTYDTRSAPDALLIHGPMGSVVYRTALSGANGLVEVDVRNWASGVYLARTELEGIPLAEAKFVVAGRR